MARPLRVQYLGAVYHITCRGNERRAIFKEDNDRQAFLDILANSLNIYTVKLFSYVLMENHFHMLVETPLGNLGAFMRHFNITYTSYYNRKYKRSGHLYQGRYKSILVDKESYLSVLSRYIHLNLVKMKEMEKKSRGERVKYLKKYPWSSLPGYLDEKNKEEFIDYSMVLEEFGGDSEKGRKAYEKRIFADLSDGIEINCKIIGQSILGNDRFIKWVKGTLVKRKRDRECPAHNELRRYRAKEEIIAAIEKELGKKVEQIKREKGSDRQMVMDLLYRAGGLTGVEIGEILGVDYSTVSQGRKRLREKIKQDRKLKLRIDRIERTLSI